MDNNKLSQAAANAAANAAQKAMIFSGWRKWVAVAATSLLAGTAVYLCDTGQAMLDLIRNLI